MSREGVHSWRRQCVNYTIADRRCLIQDTGIHHKKPSSRSDTSGGGISVAPPSHTPTRRPEKQGGVSITGPLSKRLLPHEYPCHAWRVIAPVTRNIVSPLGFLSRGSIYSGAPASAGPPSCSSSLGGLEPVGPLVSLLHFLFRRAPAQQASEPAPDGHGHSPVNRHPEASVLPRGRGDGHRAAPQRASVRAITRPSSPLAPVTSEIISRQSDGSHRGVSSGWF
jgi:hypothetical protein